MSVEDTGLSQALTESQKAYLNYFKNEGYRKNISNLEHLFYMNRKELKIEAEKQIQRLSELKIDRKKSSKKVRRGWKVLESFIQDKTSELKKGGIVALVYGSMIFDDANNLDYDLLFVSEHENPDMRKKYKDWDDEMLKRWRGIGTEGHLEKFSIYQLRAECNAFQNNRAGYIEKYGFYVERAFSNASIVIMGEIINPNELDRKEDVKKLKKIQGEIWELADETPELLASKVFSMQDTTVTRETRRSGLADHQTGELEYRREFIRKRYPDSKI